jgi:hypothetical protein
MNPLRSRYTSALESQDLSWWMYKCNILKDVGCVSLRFNKRPEPNDMKQVFNLTQIWEDALKWISNDQQFILK